MDSRKPGRIALATCLLAIGLIYLAIGYIWPLVVVYLAAVLIIMIQFVRQGSWGKALKQAVRALLLDW
jgi:hypothetical protein